MKERTICQMSRLFVYICKGLAIKTNHSHIKKIAALTSSEVTTASLNNQFNVIMVLFLRNLIFDAVAIARRNSGSTLPKGATYTEK